MFLAVSNSSVNGLIIVGLNPSKVKVQDLRKNSTHDKLKQWLDEWGIDKVCFTNLTGDPYWDFKCSHLDKEWIINQLHGHDKVVALGSKVSQVLSSLNIEHFKMPHPSPRNRQLNDKTFEQKMIAECKQYIYNI